MMILYNKLDLTLAGYTCYYFSYDCVSCYPIDLTDTELHTLVKSHVKINLGGRSVLKVNKSEGGDLFWTHNGNLIEVNQDSHYTFVDTEGSSGTGVEIFDATAEQGGLYEVVLMEGGCEVRNIIDVQVQGKYRQKITS